MSNKTSQKHFIKNNVIGAIPLPSKFLKSALEIESKRQLEIKQQKEAQDVIDGIIKATKTKAYCEKYGITDIKGPTPKFEMPFDFDFKGSPDKLNYLDPLFTKARLANNAKVFYKKQISITIPTAIKNDLECCRIEGKDEYQPDEYQPPLKPESIKKKTGILYSSRVLETNYYPNFQSDLPLESDTEILSIAINKTLKHYNKDRH